MPVIISYDDVTNGYSTTVSQDEVEMLIDIVAIADDCLDAAGVADQKQRALKLYAVRHMLQMQANGGQGVLTGRRAPSGASQSFAAWKGVGVGATVYGTLLKSLDATGCLVSILENDDDRYLSAWSIGGCGCEQLG